MSRRLAFIERLLIIPEGRNIYRTFAEKIFKAPKERNVCFLYSAPTEPNHIGRRNTINIRLLRSQFDHCSFQCTVANDCGSKSLSGSATFARRSEYSSVVTTFPSTLKITSGDIQPPPS